MHIKHLKALWKEAFHEPDAAVDCFFSFGYSSERCAVIETDRGVAAALYWFDCSFEGRKLAYLYGVATAKAFRGMGLCKQLLKQTHQQLKKAGYSGCILVPATPELYTLYNKAGYETCTRIAQSECRPGAPVALTPICPEEYAQERKKFLPAGSVMQEGVSLHYLSQWCQFYKGEACLVCGCVENDTLLVQEFLGDAALAPGITAALGAKKGNFRMCGQESPFAMYLSLDGSPAPSYFGLALD